MKIIFLGTPEFAVASLRILYENGYEIPVVVTAPAKKAGRGLQLKQPAIKLFADEAGIPTLQPGKLSDPTFIETLKKINADLFVVVAFRMLPEQVWKMPPLGTFNLHSSLLPQYRGAAPINRAVMNGETETGVTTFFLKHEIDTGNIIFREPVPILPDETAGELHDKLMKAGADLVLKTVQAIESGTVKEISQDELGANNIHLHTAPKIFSNDCLINWSWPSYRVHNHIRGLSPFPAAFTILSDENNNHLQLKIYRSRVTELASDSLPGILEIINGQLFINCSDNKLQILELQLEGKKRMAASDFLQGFRVERKWKCIQIN